MVETTYITPDWPAPPHIHALSTLRSGGNSQPPYDSFNLGDHVGDSEEHVEKNRAKLCEIAELPKVPLWLRQTHSTLCIRSDDWQPDIEADACYTEQFEQVCLVMTADCLPLLICDQEGNEVAAVHAGWRGLCEGVIESTLAQFQAPASELLVWLGPAIGPKAFEVGLEVKDAFIKQTIEASHAFRQTAEHHYHADIYQLARQRLEQRGIHAIYGGDRCTLSEPRHFFSYRRDGVTGRMASLIWKSHK